MVLLTQPGRKLKDVSSDTVRRRFHITLQLIGARRSGAGHHPTGKGSEPRPIPDAPAHRSHGRVPLRETVS